MNKAFMEFLAKSKFKKILNDRKNFIGSKVEYAHDKNRNIYSINIKMSRGDSYLLTLIVGDHSVEMALSDRDGNVIEHMLHDGDKVVYG
ncbi:TPA: hypothetical protein EYP38_02705 [Candidatus Micrarchaeota archaeon]|nr:hypothetical protein [Candidatus Micrarchaeota archaeon]